MEDKGGIKSKLFGPLSTLLLENPSENSPLNASVGLQRSHTHLHETVHLAGCFTAKYEPFVGKELPEEEEEEDEELR